jgi:excisionase family DNA binding protein
MRDWPKHRNAAAGSSHFKCEVKLPNTAGSGDKLHEICDSGEPSASRSIETGGPPNSVGFSLFLSGSIGQNHYNLAPRLRYVGNHSDLVQPENLAMAERWLSVEEIAAHLGVNRDTIYKWIGRKKMPAHKVGRLWKFLGSEVDRWVKQGKAA